MKAAAPNVNKDLAHSVESGQVILFDCPPLLFSDQDHMQDMEALKRMKRFNLPTTYYRDNMP